MSRESSTTASGAQTCSASVLRRGGMRWPRPSLMPSPPLWCAISHPHAKGLHDHGKLPMYIPAFAKHHQPCTCLRMSRICRLQAHLLGDGHHLVSLCPRSQTLLSLPWLSIHKDADASMLYAGAPPRRRIPQQHNCADRRGGTRAGPGGPPRGGGGGWGGGRWGAGGVGQMPFCRTSAPMSGR